MTEALRFHRILVATDFSETAERALAFAKALAKGSDRAVLLLAHVHFVPLEIEALAVRGAEQVFTDIHEHARAQLAELAGKLRDEGFDVEYEARDGVVDTVLLDIANDLSADVIVMGTHARRGLGHVVLGSIAERVLRHAPCPVVVVPPPA